MTRDRIQLPYAIVADAALKLPSDLAVHTTVLPSAIPGRRIPNLARFSDLSSPFLSDLAVPLPEANTLAHLAYQSRHFGRLQTSPNEVRLFNPEIVLVKFRGARHVAALRVESMREWDAVQALAARPDVEFAELDTFEQRQFSPDDPQLMSQWHHAIIGSFQAWNYGLGQSAIRVAIVDTPFQMAHPDLAGNSLAGWDVVANTPVTEAPGIVHSTMCAGLAAAAINNHAGVAGVANCSVLPININGAISEMYNAVIWAAENGVRVVSISWSGANSDTLEAAAYYLKTRARGLLFMAAIDGSGFLNWTNQPDIYCVSMTDAADNFTGTKYGPYIDFAAPGYQVYSTTTGSGYAAGNGTSYATPLVAGIAAWLLGLNLTLGPDDVIALLQNTARDLGPAGVDSYFGWGRIDFGAAAAAAQATLPRIAGAQFQKGQFTLAASFQPGLIYSLWRTPQLSPPAWSLVSDAITTTNGPELFLTDPAPPAERAFYRIQTAPPASR